MGNPVRFTEAERTRLLDFLETEHNYAIRSVYDPLQAKRELWNDCYYGITKPRAKEWMSNFPILFGATCTDAVTARLLNTMWAYSPIYTFTPYKESNEWGRVAKALEKYIDYKVRGEMKFYRESRKFVFELVRLGSGLMMTPWVRETVKEERKVLGVPIPRTRATTNFVRPKALPLRDFIAPGGYSELNELPWWTRMVRWDEMMLKQFKVRTYFENVDKVLPYKTTGAEGEDAETKAATRAGEQPEDLGRVRGRETWCWFSRKDNGEYERYVVTWHPLTRLILRIEEDTYPSWPLLLYRYGPRDYGLYGLGIIEMAMPFENALWALYNTLVDNFQVATYQCFKARKGSGIAHNTEVYTGKIFMMDDVEKDFVSFALGQAYTLNPTIPKMVWDLGERRVGVNDYALGRESPIVGRGATATGTLALIQEGQRRYDLTIHDVRDVSDDFGEWLLEMTHRYGDRKEPYYVLGAGGKYVEEFLQLPRGAGPRGQFAIKSGISHVALNKEVEKQAALTSFQILGQYYDKIIQALQMLGNPQVPPVMKEVVTNMLVASQEKVRRILETLGEPSPGEYVNVLTPILGGQRGAPGSTGPGPEPGMEGTEGGAIGEEELPPTAPTAERPAGV